MPITPHFTWRECPSSVTIDVALRSVSPSSIDILTTDCYVKVNCSPYLFQADLFGEIKSDKSSAIIDKDLVKFLLVKKKEGLWGRLNAIGEKKDTLLKREKSLESARQHAQKLKEEAKAKIARIGRLAVENQMKLDETKCISKKAIPYLQMQSIFLRGILCSCRTRETSFTELVILGVL